ncbi:MAG TPA: hypothetical protein VGP82_14410, partial [Ktedonobacterales bacterium]|nr:hypothetical protein [Ktedonobacterales bacterium]
EAADALQGAGAPVVRMSGSGPTLYAPFRRLAVAKQVHEIMQQSTYQTWLCHGVNRDLMQAAIPGPDDKYFRHVSFQDG